MANVALDGDLSEWNGATAAWLSCNWSWILVPRRQSQIMEGAGPLGNPPYRLDARAAFCAGWGPHYLYLAVRLDDDQPLPQARVRISIDTPHGVAYVDLKPNDKATMVLNGETTTLPTGATDTTFERSIPWATPGLSLGKAKAISFDLAWTDADDEEGTILRRLLRRDRITNGD